MQFLVKSVKTCRKHTKFALGLPAIMDDSFFNHFAIYGQPEIMHFSSFSPKSVDFFRLRSDSFGFEMSGPVNGMELKVTFRKTDQEMIDTILHELSCWVDTKTEKVA